MKKTALIFTLLAMLAGPGFAQQCNALFSATSAPGNPAIQSFTDQSTASSNIVSHAWDFGDGSNSTQTNPTHTYTTQGPWVVCLTITTSLNCTSTYCDTVGTSSQVSCTAAMSATTSLLTANFTASGSGTGTPIGYSWDFGDGNTSFSGTGSTSHTYAANGTYNAMVAIDYSDSCRALDFLTVTVSNGQVFCTPYFTAINTGLSVNFQDSSVASAAIISWSWTFGDGNMTTTGFGNVNHTYAQAGTYPVCLTISTADSCTSTFCDSVVVGGTQSGCQAGFSHYPDTTGQYTIIGVNTSQGNNLSYLWDFGDGNSSTAQFPVHQYAGAGTYTICLTVTNGPNCTSTFCDTVVVTQKINAPFTFAVLSPTTAIAPSNIASNSLELYPNPARDLATLRLDLQAETSVSLRLMDLQGRTVLAQDAGSLASGEHHLKIATDALPTGLYMARIQLGEQVITKKLMLRQ